MREVVDVPGQPFSDDLHISLERPDTDVRPTQSEAGQQHVTIADSRFKGDHNGEVSHRLSRPAADLGTNMELLLRSL